MWLNDEVMVIKVLALLALLSCAACQDAGFECAWRSLAYDYGRELLPAYGAFPTLFDALELASLCNHTQPESRMDGALPAPLNGPSVKIGTGDGIYVDPAAGSDRLVEAFCVRGMRAIAPREILARHDLWTALSSRVLFFYPRIPIVMHGSNPGTETQPLATILAAVKRARVTRIRNIVLRGGAPQLAVLSLLVSISLSYPCLPLFL